MPPCCPHEATPPARHISIAPGHISPFEPSDLSWFIHRNGPDDLTTAAPSRAALEARIDAIPVGGMSLWFMHRIALILPDRPPIPGPDLPVTPSPLTRGLGHYFIFGDHGHDTIQLPPPTHPGVYSLGFPTAEAAFHHLGLSAAPKATPAPNERFIIARLHEVHSWH